MEILEITSKEAAAALMSLAAPLWFWKYWKKNSRFTFKHIFLNREFPKIGNSFLGFKPLFLGIKPFSKQNFLLPTYPRNISAQKM